ncbi:hypothetical protein JCM10908_004643 [Rhodotorula pacifica]|uniref:uncharacterized protein n=1 Tax=Rhodotorula pacifica TaxID=1495444 RepID=UPI003179D5E5
MAQSSPNHTLKLSLAHAGRTLELSPSADSSARELAVDIATAYHLAPTSVKLVIKGKKVNLGEASVETVADLIPGAVGGSAIKALVVGTKAEALESLRAEEDLRRRKHDAYVHHQQHAAAARPARRGVHTFGGGGNDPANYRFHHLEPFPKTVPFYERRRAMLERLSEDLAVRDVMKRHKFVVGVLTELHPVLHTNHSTGEKLLGLNTNAGEKVSLRLLTDDLDGLRSYNDVRRVLLHELTHNQFGGHGNDFKELNSQLNKELAAFESSPEFEPWDPPNSRERSKEEHRLNEEEAERVWDRLQFGQEELFDERRERMRIAAEERAKRAAQSRPL